MELYLYQVENMLTFKRNIVDAVGIYLEHNGKFIQGGLVSPHDGELLPYHQVLAAFFKELGELSPPDATKSIEVCGMTTPWLIKAFTLVANGNDDIVPSTDEAKRCVEVLRNSGYAFTLTDPEKVKAKHFKGDVGADCACDSAITYYEQTSEPLFIKVSDVKELSKKTSTLNPLLVDNMVIDRLRNDNTYYCCEGDKKKRVPKVDKTIDALVRTRHNDSHVYFTGNNNKLRNFGMYTANERYHVVILNEREDYLEKIFNFQRDVNKGLHRLPQETVFRLKEISGKGINTPVSNNDFTPMGITDNGDLYANNFKRRDLSYVMSPPRLKFKVFRRFDWVEEVLRRFIAGDKTLHTTDVTDFFYTVGKDGKRTMNPDRNKDEEKLTISDVNYEGGTTSIIALYKVTMPTFQEFKRWVKYEPRVWIQTRQTDDHVITYTFIIQTTLGYLHYTCPVGGVKVLRKASKKARVVNNDKKSRK